MQNVTTVCDQFGVNTSRTQPTTQAKLARMLLEFVLTELRLNRWLFSCEL